MKVENALILAAGKGTRMGEIGKHLPKVLWPVFEKSLLELEVLYAKELGAQRVFINSYYYTKELLNHVENNPIFSDVEVLVEQAPIDIGGAVHNLAEKIGYRGNLLILNSDQFIFMEKDIWNKAFEKLKSSDAVLFAHEVNSSDNYNALALDKDRLVGITPNSELERDKKVHTYTGMSLIKLDKLQKVAGMSKFFDSVADFKSNDIRIMDIASSPYWDFGTLSRYWKSSFKILNLAAGSTNDMFVNFLISSKALHSEKVGKDTYNTSSGSHVINLSNASNVEASQAIILEGNGINSVQDEREKILFNDIVEYI
ncbi:MAG: NTP transferase domain-containing protein [Bacteriovoracaceae bacterium]|nr:NTP transferase domain-containing protein [Bacteriovoracaceae bacterium]